MHLYNSQLCRLVAILLTLWFPLTVTGQSQIYKWTDKHGHVHYSDKDPQIEPAEQLKLNVPNIMRSQQDAFWSFEFDGREWVLGSQDANQTTSLREYILVSQDIDDWTELVTSQYMKTSLSIRQYYEQFWRENPDCPSLEVSKVDETIDTIDTIDTIIFQGKHGACGGYEPGEFVQRISGIDGGILNLTFSQKGQLTVENRSNWTKILSEAKTKHSRTEGKGKAKSLPLNQLGSLPDNTVSEYLKTLSAGLTVNLERRAASFAIRLKMRKGLPAGAYLEVHFPDPSDLDKKNIVSEVIRSGETDALFTSPQHRSIKCWNYEVLVYIYRGNSKTRLLGEHRQTIQSRVNYARIKDDRDLVSAMRTSRCP